MNYDPAKCKEKVWDGWNSRQCSRSVWRDGYCKQHHPDEVKKRRDAAMERYEEKLKKSPYVRLADAKERIAELESEVKSLRQQLDAVIQGGEG